MTNSKKLEAVTTETEVLSPASSDRKFKSARERLLARLQPDRPYMEISGSAKLAGYINRQGQTVEYVELTLNSPFPEDHDLPPFVLEAKWKSDKSIFKYRAKKALATVDSLPIEAVISPYEYFNKKYRKQVLYIGIFAIDPFSPGRTIELQVRDESDRTLWSVLFRDFWGMSHIDVDDADDDTEADR